LLTGYSEQREYRKPLVAPVNLRERMTALIRKAPEYGAEGPTITRMKQITAGPTIRELYRPAQPGVQLDLLVRRCCAPRTAIPGVSENIRVISILGRFLEHARAYYCKHGSADDREYVIAGSADLMPRNLDYRVEVLFPIEDPALMAYVRDD